MNNPFTMALALVNKCNETIMDWFYKNADPSGSVEDLPESPKKEALKECIKWYGEMGEYWCDDAQRITKNLEWGNNLIKKIEALTA